MLSIKLSSFVLVFLLIALLSGTCESFVHEPKRLDLSRHKKFVLNPFCPHSNHSPFYSKSQYLSSFRHMKKDNSAFWFTILGKSAKYVVSGTVASILLLNESLLPLYYVSGAVLNSLFGKFLKNIIKQPRPIESKKRGYGMPSSHTTAISYFIAIICLKGSSVIADKRLQASCNILVLAYGILACFWRIQSQLHTTAQILAGMILGLTSASLAIRFEAPIVTSLDALITRLQERSSLPVALTLKLGLTAAAGLVVFSRNIRLFLASQKKEKDKER